ncbi:MAG TPA: chemotaxis protein CheD [Opitutaceae bacterium]
MSSARASPSPFLQRVVIGVGDLAVSNDPSVTLSTYALGSCIAVIGYDPQVRVGGILHLMLPDSRIAPARAAGQPGMFANTGLPLLFKSLQGLRADLTRLRLFVAGGANVLAGTDAFRIGEKNIKATEEFLSNIGFEFSHAAVGGSINRTIHLQNATGLLTLRTPVATEEYSLAD